MSKHDLTQKQLKEILHYDPETGIWTWLVRRGNNARTGKRAGCLDNTGPRGGYNVIKINGYIYKAGRLSFFYMTGQWPKAEVDHLNRSANDDRWNNLREATRSENNLNRSFKRAALAR